MKKRKTSAVLSLLGLTALFTTLLTHTSTTLFATANSENYLLSLDNSSQLVTSTGYNDYSVTTYKHGELKFTRAKALADGLCSLEKGGKIYKTDASNNLKTVKATFTGGLQIVTSFDEAFTYATKITLTTDTSYNIAGNYFYIVATKATDVVSLDVTYDCLTPATFNKSNFSKTTLTLNNNSSWSTKERTDLAGFKQFDNKVYYYVKGTFKGNAVAECFKYYTEGKVDTGTVLTASIFELSGTSMTLYFDITNVTGNYLYSHLSFNGAAWNGGDGNISYSSGTSSATKTTLIYTGEGTNNSQNVLDAMHGDKRYTISIAYCMANINVETGNFFRLSRYSGEYHFEQDGEIGAFVLSYKYTGTWSDSLLENIKLYSDYDKFPAPYKAVADQTRQVVDMYFDLTEFDYTVDGVFSHYLKVTMNGVGVQLGQPEPRTSQNRNEHFYFNGYKYTITNNANYNSVILKVETQPKDAETGVVTPAVRVSKDQSARLETIDDKVYYVVYGTYAGEVDLENLLTNDIILEKTFAKFDRIEKQDNGLFKAYVDVTDIGANKLIYPHVKYNDATVTESKNGDIISYGRDIGYAQLLGDYVYYLHSNGGATGLDYAMTNLVKASKDQAIVISRNSIYLDIQNNTPNLVLRATYFGDSIDASKLVLSGSNNQYAVAASEATLDTETNELVARFDISNFDGDIPLFLQYNNVNCTGISTSATFGRIACCSDYINNFGSKLNFKGRTLSIVKINEYIGLSIL